MSKGIDSIVVIGDGLAAHLTSLALAQLLPTEIGITLVGGETENAADIFYGNVTPPTAYDFLLNIGITEPDLLLSTQTSFSLGTKFENWGPQRRSWTQSFNRPLPIHHGVSFHHYVNLHSGGEDNWSLDPFLMSTQAAHKGVFAHPPEGKNIPLAAVEYGYHFDPREWSELISKKLEGSRIVKWSSQAVDFTPANNGVMTAISLEDGTIVKGDLFIDCTGHQDSTGWHSHRSIRGVKTVEDTKELSSVIRNITETGNGWKAVTPLRGKTHALEISGTESKAGNAAKTPGAHDLNIGRVDAPWQKNILKLGHGAGALEPLTAAPMILLQRDIERLVELIPTSNSMTIEAREYNRRFAHDYDHAAMFHRAMFNKKFETGSSYREAIETKNIRTALGAKLTQFEQRGVCVQYDNEPFSEQDWVLLHLGQGRMPARYDPLTDRIPAVQIAQMLGNMAQANTQMAAKMPPVEKYMTGLLRFLKEKHG